VSNEKKKNSMLLHSCCGPCSTAVITRLMSEFDLSVFYYNPNITDAQEYELRKTEQMRFLRAFNEEHSTAIRFIEGTYEPDTYLRYVAGLEQEREGGRRCAVCFQLRLAETARRAADDRYDFFDTTLSVSPHKDYETLLRIGKELEILYGVRFAAGNYKKKNGFAESLSLSRQYGLYRQDYCGCEFSRRDR